MNTFQNSFYRLLNFISIHFGLKEIKRCVVNREREREREREERERDCEGVRTFVQNYNSPNFTFFWAIYFVILHKFNLHLKI